MKDIFTIDDAQANKDLLRQIAETGQATRTKAIKIGILPELSYRQVNWIDRAQGDGHREYPELAKKARKGQWRIISSSGEVLLQSRGFQPAL